jgi:hypothetical protein
VVGGGLPDCLGVVVRGAADRVGGLVDGGQHGCDVAGCVGQVGRIAGRAGGCSGGRPPGLAVGKPSGPQHEVTEFCGDGAVSGPWWIPVMDLGSVGTSIRTTPDTHSPS